MLGRKTGGRSKGTPNRRKAALAAAAATVAAGDTPLDVMLRVMREATEDSVRLDAAKAAAPYVHPRLAAVEHRGSQGSPIQVVIQGTDAGLL